MRARRVSRRTWRVTGVTRVGRDWKLPGQWMMAIDWRGVAERIRGLVRVEDEQELLAAAERMGVDARYLRESLDGTSRLSALRVVNAVVRTYGLDPSWVLTGVYDAQTHKAALRQDANEIDTTIRRLVSGAGAAGDRRDDRYV
jgi:hypothetical protein